MDLVKLASVKKLRLVIGFVRDKDIKTMLELLPGDGIYYWCAAALPRALASDELMAHARHFNLSGRAFSSVEAAMKMAKHDASEDDLIFVGGSTFVVAEVLSTFEQNKRLAS
jgi:dihydrofolate synthase/folylpolyglutamate synthase